MTTLPPGTVLGRYELRRLLGQGGMGAVYEAVHTALQRRVAVKTLRPGAGMDAGLRARFVREGQLSARVEHPHVVQVLDVGATGELLYLVMECLDGEDLKAILAREGRLGVERALDLLLPVIAGVAEAHREGIVHRDLKPANIFLHRSRDGLVVPKVLDFGIARMLDAPEAELTQTKLAMGTVGYMSPEQVQSARRADAASDQYALGAVLYHCLTGRKPFVGEFNYELMTAVVTGDFPAPRALAPEVPEAVERVVLRAMHTAPAARFPSVVELGRALLAFASPMAQARWAPVFGAPAEESGGTPLVAPRASPPAGETPGTLSAAATTVPPAPAAAPRRRALAALVAAGALALGGAVWGVAASRVAAVAPSPAALAQPPVAAPTLAPPANAAPVAALAAPSLAAPVVAPAPTARTASAAPPEDPADEPAARRRHGRSSRRSRRGATPPGTSASGTNAMPILE